ncbi:MAG TPA: hypothetical protein VJU02_08340, partial [Nitrospiraceae bacterium]|nr:hypothetical protein [Nitrospiraceae bacterium]
MVQFDAEELGSGVGLFHSGNILADESAGSSMQTDVIQRLTHLRWTDQDPLGILAGTSTLAGRATAWARRKC